MRQRHQGERSGRRRQPTAPHRPPPTARSVAAAHRAVLDARLQLAHGHHAGSDPGQLQGQQGRQEEGAGGAAPRHVCAVNDVRRPALTSCPMCQGRALQGIRAIPGSQGGARGGGGSNWGPLSQGAEWRGAACPAWSAGGPKPRPPCVCALSSSSPRDLRQLHACLAPRALQPKALQLGQGALPPWPRSPWPLLGRALRSRRAQ